MKKSLIELSSHDTLLAQNKFLSKQLEILTKTLGKLPTKLSMGQPTHSFILQVTGCTICGEAHETGQCIPLIKTLKKFMIWEINIDKGILKEDF